MVLSSEQRHVFLVTVSDVARRSHRELVLGDGLTHLTGDLGPLDRLRSKQTRYVQCRRMEGLLVSTADKLIFNRRRVNTFFIPYVIRTGRGTGKPERNLSYGLRRNAIRM